MIGDTRTRGNGKAEVVLADSDADLGTREARAKPARALSGPPTRLILPALVFGVGLVGLFGLPNHLVYAGSTALWYGMVGLGLYLPLVALRELPLNGAALAGLSAYLFAYVASDGGAGPAVAGILVAVGVTVALSMLGGLASLVVTGLYFAVASLVVQIGIEKVVFSMPELTGGASGRSVPQPTLTGYFDTNRVVFLIAGLVCLTVTVAVWYVKRTKHAANWILTGHQPEGAEAVGVRKWGQKLIIFGLSGMLIGIGGCLAAFVNGTPPSVPQFTAIWSVIFLALPIASGLRTLGALWTVAAVFTALPIVLAEHRINPNLLSGGILLTAVIVSQTQESLVARLRRRRLPDLDLGALEGGDGPAAPLVVPRPTSGEIDLRPTSARTLRGSGISVTFGGIKAVDDVSIEVGPGERMAIVGANGAGKTTLFNALTGFVPLERGQVTLGEENLAGVPAFARVRAGLGRTFQLPRLADVLTVRQNIVCGQAQPGGLADRAEWLMERFGLTSLAGMPIDMVPFGIRRKVEMARALARRPEVLLVDEPVSGLEDEEVNELLDILIELQAAEGWGLLVIEHDLRFVTAIAEQLMVMENGRVITDGPVDKVLADRRVRRVYLGEVVTV